MSDYPPTAPYGVSYGAQDHTNPPYLPPTYPNQYLQPDNGRTGQTHMTANYDAYGYNRAVPAFSAAAVASGIPPLPIYQGWNQDPIPLPPYTAPQSATQYAGYMDNSHQNNQYYPAVNQTNYQQDTQVGRHFEQGELSEGEFEDGAAVTNTPPIGHGASHYRGNDGTGYVDTAQRAVYSRNNDYHPQAPSYPANNYHYPSRDSPQTRRHQSDSYSPYISPQEDNEGQSTANQYHDQYTPSHPQEPTAVASQQQSGWPPNGTVGASESNAQTNGYHTPNIIENINQQTNSKIQPTASETASVTNGRSTAEGRKKAQGAILNLLPYGIRYQTYIDEGFKEDIVDRLFNDLRIPRNPKSANGTEILEGFPNNTAEASQGSNQLGNIPPISNSSPASRNQLPKVGKQTLQPSSVTNPLAGSAPAAAMNDKERIMQEKMEALRKSREERAQKAAAKSNAKPAAAPATIIQPEPKPEPPKAAEIEKVTSSASNSPIPGSQQHGPDHVISSRSPAQAQAPNFEQQAPVIPGLFLASTASSPAPATSANSAMNAPTSSAQRKRPVAADFNQTPASVAPYKRPFGHSRNEQPLVIDVSDEEAESEDEDVAMDLESQADQDSPVQAASKMSDQRSTAIQSLPPLTNLPTRRGFSSPSSSAANTPPISHSASRASLGRPEVLQRKESEIEELKRRIAEKEARNKAKQSRSGTRTPRAAEASGSEGNGVHDNVASNVEASMQMQHQIGIAENQIKSNQQRLADAQTAEIEQAAELKKNEAEQNRLRREQIEADLPILEMETQQGQARLEQMRAEIAKMEAEVQMNLEKKQKITEELARLGQDIEDRLQEKKEILNALTKDETESIDASHEIHTYSTVPSRRSSLPISNEEPSKTSATTVNVSLPVRSTSPELSRPIGTIVNGHLQADQPSPAQTANGNLSHVNEPSVTEPRGSSADPKEKVTDDHALEAALQEAVRAEADAHAHEGSDVDMENLYALDPNQLAPDSPAAGSEEGELSPEYSPVLHRTVSDVPDRESDDYEPPEATPAIDMQDPIESPPFSPAPPETISEPAIHPAPDDDLQQASDEMEQEGVENTLPQQNGSAPRPQQLIEDAGNRDTPHFFTPYESPLQQFRAYRFQSAYKQQVPGGLRSLTYSHKISPNTEFCRYELAGGICNDATCEFQHFKDIGLPDDVILTALGSPEEFNGERRDQFCDGLKEVLMDLRVRKIRDFDTIAAEILAYRANFLGDNSKVLPLEGTSI